MAMVGVLMAYETPNRTGTVHAVQLGDDLAYAAVTSSRSPVDRGLWLDGCGRWTCARARSAPGRCTTVEPVTGDFRFAWLAGFGAFVLLTGCLATLSANVAVSTRCGQVAFLLG